PPCTPPFPYTTLFRSERADVLRTVVGTPGLLHKGEVGLEGGIVVRYAGVEAQHIQGSRRQVAGRAARRIIIIRQADGKQGRTARSEEHTSELQSRENL